MKNCIFFEKVSPSHLTLKTSDPEDSDKTHGVIFHTTIFINTAFNKLIYDVI